MDEYHITTRIEAKVPEKNFVKTVDKTNQHKYEQQNIDLG
jgi:hypothetical protein